MSIDVLSDCNMFGRLFDWVDELGLGSKTYTGVLDVRVSNTVAVGPNLRWDVMVAPNNAMDTMLVEVFLSDADGPTLTDPPDFSVTVDQDNGNGEGHLDFVTTDAEQYVTLRLTPGAAGALLKNSLEAKDLMPLVNGVRQGYHEAVGGFNKVPTTAAYAPVSYVSE